MSSPHSRLAPLCLLFVLTHALIASTPAVSTQPPTAAASPEANQDDDEKNPASPPAKLSQGEEKFWEALQHLRKSDPQSLARGRELLQSSADLEFTHAQTLLANLHLAGNSGFKKDPKRAAALFRLAAERGNAFAKISLGQCLLTGTGVRKDKTRAAEWLSSALDPQADFSRPTPPPDFNTTGKDISSAVSAGNIVIGEQAEDPIASAQASAHYLLALLASENKDDATAHTHYLAAATAGTAGREGLFPAAVQAALDFAFGRGTPRDLAQATALLEQSGKLTTRTNVSLIHNYSQFKVIDDFAVADLEELASKIGEETQQNLQREIAATLNNKKSKDYNPHEAVKWYELAAQNGDPWAMLTLAFLYTDGTLGTPDPAKAFVWFEKVGSGEKPKHYLGAANLAICLHHGIGTAPDPARAREIANKSKNNDFICYLGSLGKLPEKPLTFEQVFALLKKWADNKDPQAQYFLGERYENGWGVEVSPKKAVSWYKKAAKAGHITANFRLGVLYQFQWRALDEDYADSIKAAFTYYEKGALAADPNSQASLAYLYSTGAGVSKNTAQSQLFYEKCVAQNPLHDQASNNLAVIYENQALRAKGEEARTLSNKAITLYEIAEKQGLALAAENLAKLYREGKLVPLDQQAAYQHYEKAAELGSADAHYALGQIHEKGEGVPITLAEAAYHYRLAALDGHYAALARICDLYLARDSNIRDLDRALFWLSLSAQRGGLNAITKFGDVCMQKGDYDTAYKLFSDLEQNGFASQQTIAAQRLSILYENGWGVKKNPRKAARYRDQAAKAGNLPALHDTAMHKVAEGKIPEAIALLEKCAARNFAPSLYELALLYRKTGRSFPAEIQRLISQSAKAGHEDAELALATDTLNNLPGAPSLAEAIAYATRAASTGNEQARELKAKLEKRARDTSPH